jgi:cellulose biosynthesis protein BcsQ
MYGAVLFYSVNQDIIVSNINKNGESLMKSVVFFNNKGGVGKTTFTYHLGYALERKGKRVLFVDADPQCNLSSHVCTEEAITNAWGSSGNSIYKAVEPIITGAGAMKQIDPYKLPDKNIWIYIGDLMLSDFESELTNAWTQILAGQERGFRVTSSINSLFLEFANKNDIDYVLIDIGPNLGALNRSILLGCDHFIIPMIPDMFSLRGSQNIGRVFANWIINYQAGLKRLSNLDFFTSKGTPKFSGYTLQQFNKYNSRRTKAYEEWAEQIPDYIEKYVIKPLSKESLSTYELVLRLDNYQIAEFKNYNTLIPMAQSALKPVFELSYSDGIVGGHTQYVTNAKREFEAISSKFLSII